MLTHETSYPNFLNIFEVNEVNFDLLRKIIVIIFVWFSSKSI